MTEVPLALTIIDKKEGLQTRSFLLVLNCDSQTLDVLKPSLDLLTKYVIVIPGYSSDAFDVYRGHTLQNENYTFSVKNIYVPPLNFIGTLNETLTALVRIYIYKTLEVAHTLLAEQFGGLELIPFNVADAIPLEYTYDIIQSTGAVPFIKWTHSSLYKEGCFSCQMGVRELMRAIDFCKGKIVTDKAHKGHDPHNFIVVGSDGESSIEFKGQAGAIILNPSVDIENEFVNWFTSSFQGTLEAAHIQTIEFVTPTRTISRTLGY